MTEGAGVSLVGDIGATNARFGLVSPAGQVLLTRVFASEHYPTIDVAILAFLGERGEIAMPHEGALAIASPVTGDRIEMTNHPWRFSIAALKARLGFDRLEVINDFTALALSLPHLGAQDKRAVGGGDAVPAAPLAALGPGSGLGVSGLIPSGKGWIALSGEGGHATAAPASERESAVIGIMRRHFDHVSGERLLSGPGLVNIYNALAALDAVPARGYSAAQITDEEIAASDPRCAETVALFCAMLGTAAGNLALTLGARGGVYIGGGIVKRLGQRFDNSPFRERFEAKGRMSPYLVPIPTFVVTHELPAFLGCTALLNRA
jgi:glucokinase